MTVACSTQGSCSSSARRTASGTWTMFRPRSLPKTESSSGRVSITSQNHGFAVDAATLPANLVATHVSLFDGTLQGLARTDKPAFCFQGHPEASPGPHDIAYLFDRFIDSMTANAKKN